jgi:hypothetical protein
MVVNDMWDRQVILATRLVDGDMDWIDYSIESGWNVTVGVVGLIPFGDWALLKIHDPTE